ncbi:MAG: hypothetical protein ACFE9S_16255 [Candidatus Hermodarchaeota archaeon]
MNGNEYKYSFLEDNIIKIKPKFKKKGKEYGIATLNIKQINALAETIDLQSVAPLVSPKFNFRIETFLIPRFDDINRIAYSIKPIPDEINIEISKENVHDLLKALELGTTITKLKERGYSVEELNTALKKIKFLKYK